LLQWALEQIGFEVNRLSGRTCRSMFNADHSNVQAPRV
jgi:hypothetical protein